MTQQPTNPQRDTALLGLAMLREALECFKTIGANRTADRVRLAISSAKGAVRHAQNKDMNGGAA